MKYSALSKYRTELMGLAMLWVMLYHAWSLDLGLRLLNAVRAFGFGGVDIFILLSAMGLTPDVAVGDWDSLGRVPDCGEAVTLPVAKDETDLAAAARIARERGYSDLVEKLNRLGADIRKVTCSDNETERALS